MDQITSGLRKLILAGIGAAAIAKEKGGEVLDALSKRGEVTVEQGRVLNEELKRNLKENVRENVETVKQSVKDNVRVHVIYPEDDPDERRGRHGRGTTGRPEGAHRRPETGCGREGSA